VALNMVVQMKNQLHSLWKLCLSVGKGDWELGDYPVVIREQDVNRTLESTRLKQYRFTAYIINWGLAGAGDTKREALQALDKTFTTVKMERLCSGLSLPRLGTRVPIQFAYRERISAYAELAEDFVHCVLKLDWAWLSDESSLWDFHREETNNVLVSRIKEIYGVDVSDIESARLSEILERIATGKTPA